MIRPGALGDFIVSIPSIEALSPIEIWCSGDNVPIAETLAGRARSISATGLDLLELGLAPPGLRERLAAFDEVVSWYGANRPEFQEAVSGLPFRFLTALPREGASMHAVDFYLAQIGMPPGTTPRIQAGAGPRGSYLAVHPFSGSISKNWPLERFRAVADRVAMPVEWSAGPEEALDGARRFDSRLDLARWLGEARGYLGNDSGVSHLAAAVGTPVVALFGPSDPRVWAPRGGRVTILSQNEVTVEEVAAAVIDCL